VHSRFPCISRSRARPMRQRPADNTRRYFTWHKGSSAISPSRRRTPGTRDQRSRSAERIRTLDQPEGIVLDPAGVVITTSTNPSRIVVFAAHAVGDVAPVASIVGSKHPGCRNPRDSRSITSAACTSQHRERQHSDLSKWRDRKRAPHCAIGWEQQRTAGPQPSPSTYGASVRYERVQ